ncbi:MAG: HAMP domain-containing sensor histidine kinase [Eubacteriales bacterium]
MRTKTIKGKIFNLNLVTIMISLLLVAVVFNVTINFYFNNQVMSQLSSVASITEDTFSKQADTFDVVPNDNQSLAKTSHRIENSFDKNLSVINAQSFLVDDKLNVVQSGKSISPIQTLESTIFNTLIRLTGDNQSEKKIYMNIDHIKYAAILIPAPPNKIYINYIVIYTSLEQIKALQKMINFILLIILLVTALISIGISTSISKRISQPLSSLSQHIRSLSERKFISNINLSADNEIQELVDNVNKMSERLEIYDQAQKIFLQNASHEFRTPLMIIQSYAEGLKHEVVEDRNAATEIIIDETKRLCALVEDLLYLSRLDTDEEIYRFESVDFSGLIQNIIERMRVLTEKENIELSLLIPYAEISLSGDEEKLTRAITNIISNCKRYAQSKISVQVNLSKKLPNNQLLLTIADDGPGFESEDLANVFTRFYKGKKGKFGLGLAITKTIILKHNGTIVAKNGTDGGALFEIHLPIY